MLKSIIVNAGWLGLAQLLNYCLPVLTLPVVAHAFGPSVFGKLAAINAYAAYVALLVNYGFNYTGPRNVATLRSDAKELSRSISATISAQALLAAVACLVFLLILIFLPLAIEYKYISLVILAQVLATSFSPQWIFIGLERMRAFTLAQFLCRLVGAGCVVYWIRSPKDLLLFVAINAGVALLISAASFGILRSYEVKWQAPTFRNVASALRDGFVLFVSSIAINLYTTTNVLLVALVLGPAGAGPFALADRLSQAAGAILSPITSAIYPLVCRIADREDTVEEKSTKQLFFRLIVVASVFLSAALFSLAEPLIRLVGGSAFEAATPILRFMAFLPLVLALSNIFAVQTMMPLQMDRQVAGVVATAAILGSLGMWILTSLWGLFGAGLSVLVVESCVTVSFGIMLNRRRRLTSLFFTEWGSRAAN
jgi:PST family polysaccharide transporter